MPKLYENTQELREEIVTTLRSSPDGCSIRILHCGEDDAVVSERCSEQPATQPFGTDRDRLRLKLQLAQRI